MSHPTTSYSSGSSSLVIPASPALLSRPWETFPAYTVWRRTKTVDLSTREAHLLHGAVGVSDEIGEFFEVANSCLRRVARKNSIPESDYLSLRKEAGDLLFYRDLAQDTLLTAYASQAMYGNILETLHGPVEALDARIATPIDDLARYKLDELVIMGSKILGPVKKHYFYQVALDHESIARNLVYTLFATAYLVRWAASHVAWGDATCPGTLLETLRANVEKLDARYRDGFQYGGGDRDGKGA